jgi:acetate kinase
MKVLVVNCGSSSLKYQLIDMSNECLLCKGLVERIGLQGALLTHEVPDKDKFKKEYDIPNHQQAIKIVLDTLVDGQVGVLESIEEISAIGHRVVHGGEKFISSVIIDEDVMKTLEETIELAPLHNPPNIAGILACEAIMPNVPQVAVFDTAFHQTMPAKAYLYGLPYEDYQDNGIRRYGFHGTSHKYVSNRAAEILGKDIKKLKIIACHLGNGASITAIKNGESVDTSMGFTPLEGLVMGTRCGDLDPAIIPYLMKLHNMNMDQLNDYLNKKSGVLGISGISSDFRDIEEAAANNNERAQVAIDLFVYIVQKYIGEYVAAMNGVDVLIFTAGLGENGIDFRQMICDNMDYLGISVDAALNDFRGKERVISPSASKVTVMVVPTNEELMIARETKSLI